MNYEQKYKEALGRAKKFYNNEGCRVGMTPVDLEVIFPELKESEGEKIRKQIISFLKEFEHDHYRSLNFSSWIAWLEKQAPNVPKEEPQVYETEDGKVITYSESEGYKVIEPKFKVGDWVIDKQGIVHQIANVIENVTYHTYGYDIVGGGYFNDNSDVRLWTIEDAKEGDVLCLGDVIAIFKKYIGQEKCICYCSFCDNCYCSSCGKGGFEIPIENGEDNVYGCTNTTPANKEQRDILFAKIKEAGYEWNKDKKELKKTEQTIEIPFCAKDSELQEATYYIPKGYHAEINGNAVVIKKGEQQQEPTSHWQAVREMASIAAMQGISAFGLDDTECTIKRSIELADALVKRLKGE